MNRDQRLFDLAVKIDNVLDDLRARLAALEAGGGGGGGGGSWGSITGTLTDQADLAAALAGKQPAGSYLTANQTITLSGDVSGSGATAISVTIGPNKVTRAMLAAASGATLLGATGAGNVADLTPAQAKTVLAITASDVSGLGYFATGTDAANLSGTVAAGRLPQFTGGDVTTSGAGSANLAIGANKVLDTMLRQSAGLSVIGRASNTTGNVADITAGADGQVLRRSGTAIAFGALDLASANSVTGRLPNANLTQGAATSVRGVTGGSTADIADIQASADNVALRRVSGALAFGTLDLSTALFVGTLAAARFPALTGDVTTSAGAVSTTIANNAVTYAKMQDVTATNRFLGRITAGAGDPEELTGTQATSLLDTFTSGAKGLAPASGGGTTNFLRADGTWAAPSAGSGSPGGSDRQVQFNNAGAFGGAASIDIDADGDLRTDFCAGTTVPGADQLSFKPQRLNASGGRVMPRWLDETGTYITVQPHLGRNSVFSLQAQGNSATGFSVFGGVTPTITGATGRSVTTTNKMSRGRRLGAVSAATAGNFGGWHYTAQGAAWYIGGVAGGGFKAVFRFAPSDAATVAGAHMFVGMTSNTSAPVPATNPNTFTNSFGVAQLNGGANLNIVYGGSAAQTPIDLGANFPAGANGTTSGHEYEVIFYARPDANNKVTYRVENLTNGAIAQGELTGTAGTALPSNNTALGPRAFRSNNATALAVGIDTYNCYIESELV